MGGLERGCTGGPGLDRAAFAAAITLRLTIGVVLCSFGLALLLAVPLLRASTGVFGPHQMHGREQMPVACAVLLLFVVLVTIGAGAIMLATAALDLLVRAFRGAGDA